MAKANIEDDYWPRRNLQRKVLGGVEGMIGKVFMVGLLSCGMAVGQAAVVPKAAVPAKAMAFEVVSIRPSKPGSPWGGVEVLPDGYRAWGIGLWVSVNNAYFPAEMKDTRERLLGLPPWTTQEKYDLEAKVAPADVAEWQRQSHTRQPKVMLQAMLQTMLADRCKLVVHRSPAEITGYALVVGKHGPKLKETPAGETFPSGYLQFSDGGEVVGYRRGEKPQSTFYGASMASLAAHLGGASPGHPVQDRTGLTGRYDFVLSSVDMDPSSDGKGVVVSLDGTNPANIWNLEALGLKLEPAKIPTETVVIDHIGRPSVN
jgi:uncharacterized protein (TIGR03435 family)